MIEFLFVMVIALFILQVLQFALVILIREELNG